MRQLWQVHIPLSDFFKKLLVQRNTKINEKRNGVITLLWRLRLQENPDNQKVSSLYNTAVVPFFPYLYSRQHSWRSNLGGIPAKKSSRATLTVIGSWKIYYVFTFEVCFLLVASLLQFVCWETICWSWFSFFGKFCPLLSTWLSLPMFANFKLFWTLAYQSVIGKRWRNRSKFLKWWYQWLKRG